MSEDRELRALVEKLQGENQALRRQVLELEDVATELAAVKDANEALRRQLELADEARDKWGQKLAKMERKDLEAHVKTLESTSALLRRQLELADEVRDTWHRNATRLRRELAIAREEQLRLRRIIDDERLEHRRQLKKLKKR